MINSTLNEYLDALLEDLDKAGDDYAAITEALRAQASLLVTHWPAIKRILTNGDEDNGINGEVAVSFATKFVECGRRIKGQVKVSYAEKFTDDAEFITPDREQTEMFGGTVTIKSGEVEHTMSTDAFSKATRVLARKRK